MPMPEKRFTDYGKDFGFMMSEAPGRISREQGVLAPTDKALPAGTVLGFNTGNGQFEALDLGQADGTQNATAILAIGVRPSAEPQRIALGARQFEAAARMLFWPDGITENQLKAAEAQLATKTILVRH